MRLRRITSKRSSYLYLLRLPVGVSITTCTRPVPLSRGGMSLKAMLQSLRVVLHGLIGERKEQQRLAASARGAWRGAHYDVLMTAGSAITHGGSEPFAFDPVLPQDAACPRIERLEPAIVRAVEDQTTGGDQHAGGDRQCLTHAPEDVPLDGIPGAELALHQCWRGRTGRQICCRRAHHVADYIVAALWVRSSCGSGTAAPGIMAAGEGATSGISPTTFAAVISASCEKRVAGGDACT